MRSVVHVFAVVCALVALGCGHAGPARTVAATGELRAVHPFAGGVPRMRTGIATPIPGPDRVIPGQVRMTPIGTPTWKPVDLHVFSAPVGTASDGYAEFLTTALSLLPPPNHVFNPSLGVGPGAPHAPPYTGELAAGLEAAGFPDRAAFNLAEFSNGKGVWCVWMVVPDPGTTGSSPDFSAGPIIANGLFPIHIAGTTFRNDRVWDPFLGTLDVPALNAISPPFTVDGASHFPIFFFDNMDFAPPDTRPSGSYSYVFVMTDTSGNGWNLVASFAISALGGGTKIPG